MAQYALIADDLTGALDAGAGFARAGLRSILPLSGVPSDAPGADVLLLNTASRDSAADDAAAAARAAARHARSSGAARVYKKIDSVLRGHPGRELFEVLEIYGGRALVAPAFPAQQRTTVGGRQLVHGHPAAAHAGSIAAALGPAAARCDVYDAATDEGLQRIARAAADRIDYRIWCGSAGLAAHAPVALGLVPVSSGSPPVLPPSQRLVVLAGTPHPHTRAQLDTLRDLGWPFAVVALDHFRHERPALEELLNSALATAGDGIVVTLGLDRATQPTDQADQTRMAQLALDVVASVLPTVTRMPGTALIMTGGETALRACRALGARAIEVTGEALPGIPLGVLELPQGRFALATKSGGFGAPDALVRTAEALLGRPVS